MDEDCDGVISSLDIRIPLLCRRARIRIYKNMVRVTLWGIFTHSSPSYDCYYLIFIVNCFLMIYSPRCCSKVRICKVRWKDQMGGNSDRLIWLIYSDEDLIAVITCNYYSRAVLQTSTCNWHNQTLIWPALESPWNKRKTLKKLGAKRPVSLNWVS